MQCARWLGHPLEVRLRFELRPFSNELEQIWQRTLAYGWSSEDCGLPLAGAARAALDEYLLTLLLHHHGHNYSEELAQSVPTPVPGVVRRADRFIIDNAGAPIAVSDVADHLGISLRSLQWAFASGVRPLQPRSCGGLDCGLCVTSCYVRARRPT